MAARRKPGAASIGRGTRGDAAQEAAWLCFHDNLTQSEIAGRLGVSRATVVSYLQKARTAGLLLVTLAEEPFVRSRLARDLCAPPGLPRPM